VRHSRSFRRLRVRALEGARGKSTKPGPTQQSRARARGVARGVDRRGDLSDPTRDDQDVGDGTGVLADDEP